MIKIANNLLNMMRKQAQEPPPYLRRWTPAQLNRFNNTNAWINSSIRKPSTLEMANQNWHAPLKDPLDWKIDEVGISNDFRPVRPSTALAVRG